MPFLTGIAINRANLSYIPLNILIDSDLPNYSDSQAPVDSYLPSPEEVPENATANAAQALFDNYLLFLQELSGKEGKDIPNHHANISLQDKFLEFNVQGLNQYLESYSDLPTYNHTLALNVLQSYMDLLEEISMIVEIPNHRYGKISGV